MGVAATPQNNRFPADRITSQQCGQTFFRRNAGEERTEGPWDRLPSPLQILDGLVDAAHLLSVSG